LVKAGDTVVKGQQLAVIEPGNAQLLDARTRAELVARREAADARHARATSLLRQADEALRQAERDARRIDDLSRQGFVPASDREKAALTLAARQREREAADFEADAALHDLQQARAATARLGGEPTGTGANLWTLRAPVGGQVLSLAVESAGPVALGAAILEIGDVSRLEAVVDVLSEDATRIAPGARATLVAGDAARLEGRVARIEPAARLKVSALGIEEHRVDVIVELQSGDGVHLAVGDGYRVEGRIEVARRADALQVPVAALLRQAERWCVYAVQGGRARLRTVEIGLRNADTAEVLSGLEPGQTVVLYPGDALRDGKRITLRPQSR
jgi:HlyD family secretion protein